MRDKEKKETKESPEENKSVMFLWMKMEKMFSEKGNGQQCDFYLQMSSFNKYLLSIYDVQRLF